MCTVLFAALVLHPERADAGMTQRPTALAAMVWRFVPGFDNPLPEVFVERVEHADGIAPTPTAFGSKALIVGRRRRPTRALPAGIRLKYRLDPIAPRRHAS
jgi:hypothetical protein